MLVKTMTMVAVVAALVSGCSKGPRKDSAQATLAEYVARSFAVKSPADKGKLLELTSGAVKSTLENLTDQSFTSSFLTSKKEFIGLKIRDERKLGTDRFSITYELTYMNTLGEAKDRITNKRHAIFVSEGGKWLIAEVKNVKTLVEHQNEMNIDGKGFP